MRINANIKQVSVKVLASGDKEARIILSVVGETEVNQALKLGEVASDIQVIISTQ